MTYAKQTWNDGDLGATPISATRLSYMEQGIDDAHGLRGLPVGLPGAVAPTRYAGATVSGAPISGTFAVGDFVLDMGTKSILICTVAGTPGTWTSTTSNFIVCTSLTRPSSPFKGLTIYETDTGKILTYYGATTQWKKPWSDAWGFYGSLTNTGAPVSTTSGAYVQVGLFVNVTPEVAGRKYLITATANAYVSNAATTIGRFALRNESTVLAVAEVMPARDDRAIGFNLTATTDINTTSSTAIRMSMLRSEGAGTVYFFADADRPATITVMDIGPATGASPPGA